MNGNEQKNLYPTVRESKELAEKAERYGITKLAVSRRGGKPTDASVSATLRKRG